jgi:predicted small lipoprotein YifL
MRRLVSLAAAVLLVGLLTGCGNKGPLYLPGPAEDNAASDASSAG